VATEGSVLKLRAARADFDHEPIAKTFDPGASVKHWTIGRRLTWGFCAVVAITLVGSAFSFLQLRTIQRSARLITDDAVPGMRESARILSLSKDVRGSILQHIVTSDAAEKAQLEQRMAQLSAEVDRILADYERSGVDPGERQLTDTLEASLQEYRSVRESKVLSLSRENKQAEAFAAFKTVLGPVMTKYFDTLDALTRHNSDLAGQYDGEITRAIISSELVLAIGALVACGISGLIGFFIVTSTNRALRRSVHALTSGAQQVVSASGQVSSAAQSLSRGANEQAASLEETSASVEEMGSMTRQNAEHSQAAANLMSEVDGRVRESNAALRDMLSSMSAIQDSSHKVAKIIKTIDEIAFQTNILALNAAVEAARAGDAGMGFAVVADEVRSLAQRSAQAAKDTAGLIEESIATAHGGDKKVSQVAAAITGITESVTKVKQLVDEVSAASQQQTHALDQVATTMSRMERVTQTTAATAEESAAASEELNAQAETTMTIVTSLQALVDGAAQTSPATARVANVVPLSAGGGRDRRAAAARPQRRAPKTAEHTLPLENTGTYSRF
jgi:methyl-accepting chemotaxis protein